MPPKKKPFLTSGRDIKPFPPGSIMSFNIQNGRLEEKFLKIKPPQERISEEHDAAFRLKAALEKAVELGLHQLQELHFPEVLTVLF